MDTTIWLKTILVWNIIWMKILIVRAIRIGNNESIVPDSDPDSSDIEVLSVGLVKFLVTILIWGMNWMIMDITLLMLLLSLLMQTFLTGQLTSLT